MSLHSCVSSRLRFAQKRWGYIIIFTMLSLVSLSILLPLLLQFLADGRIALWDFLNNAIILVCSKEQVHMHFIGSGLRCIKTVRPTGLATNRKIINHIWYRIFSCSTELFYSKKIFNIKTPRAFFSFFFIC